MTTTSSAAPRLWPANGLGALFDVGAGSHRRAVAVLVLISLVLFLPGFFQIPPVDRDEAYFAQATKQMIETGDYVDIRYQDDIRYRKPVGIYWLQAAVVKTAEIFRFPNARTTPSGSTASRRSSARSARSWPHTGAGSPSSRGAAPSWRRS